MGDSEALETSEAVEKPFFAVVPAATMAMAMDATAAAVATPSFVVV